MALKCFMLSTRTATKGVKNTENLKIVFMSHIPDSQATKAKEIIATFIKQNVDQGDKIYLFDNSLTDIIEYSEIFKQECLKIGAKCLISRWQKNLYTHEQDPEHGQYMFMEV